MKPRFATLAVALFTLASTPASAQPCLWTSLAGPGPGDRKSAAIAYDSVRDRVILFGGYNAANTGLLNDTWEWDGAAWTLRATTGPAPRGAAAMAFDSARNRTVLFGGNNSTYALQQQATDTWEWDGASWLQRATGTTTNGRPAMAFDAARSRTILVSWTGAPAVITREWNGTTWTTNLIPGPSQPAGQTLVYDSIRQKTILLGVVGQTMTVWEYDGIAWTQRSASGQVPPGAQYKNAAAVFDPTRARIIMVGGEPTWENYAPETWEWDTATGVWTRRTTAHPGPRPGPALVWDPVRSRAMLFGRSIALTGGETWFYNPSGMGELLITQPPLSQTVNLYSPASFSVTTPGATAYQWYKMPRFSTTAVPIPGATDATLNIASAGLSAAGSYMVVAEGPCGPAFAQASLTVISVGCYPDCDGVGGLTGSDFHCFLNQFANGANYANCDGSTAEPILTANDFICFLQQYIEGCN